MVVRVCFLILIFMSTVQSSPEANFEDTRCRCVCPTTGQFLRSIENSTDQLENHPRRFYTKTNTDPISCNPVNIVKDQVNKFIDDSHMDAFLANCECRYESRNTVLLKVVVIFVICVIAVLAGYMVFLMCLDPMLRKKRLSINYQQHNDEMEDNIFAAAVPDDSTSTIDHEGTTRARSSSNVLGRVEAEQNRWMRKVEEQRRNIFEDHTMLN